MLFRSVVAGLMSVGMVGFVTDVVVGVVVVEAGSMAAWLRGVAI